MRVDALSLMARKLQVVPVSSKVLLTVNLVQAANDGMKLYSLAKDCAEVTNLMHPMTPSVPK
ncbi:hypothetical protein ACTXT7_006237, partial [Hymenolepis weldensis]